MLPGSPSAHRPPQPRALVALLALAPALWGCASRPVHFSSDPPGARVVLDGKDTGFVTPCLLEVPDRRQRRLDLVLSGYQTATRMLVQDTRVDLVYWADATVHYSTWNFPLWLGSADFFYPVKLTSGESPSRIFVRLRRSADRGDLPGD